MGLGFWGEEGIQLSPLCHQSGYVELGLGTVVVAESFGGRGGQWHCVERPRRAAVGRVLPKPTLSIFPRALTNLDRVVLPMSPASVIHLSRVREPTLSSPHHRGRLRRSTDLPQKFFENTPQHSAIGLKLTLPLFSELQFFELGLDDVLAVALGLVLEVVVLMFVGGFVEGFGLAHGGDDGLGEFFLGVLDGSVDDCFVLIVGVEDGGGVLGAGIVSLPIFGGRIVGGPEPCQDVAEGEGLGIVDHFNNLDVP